MAPPPSAEAAAKPPTHTSARRIPLWSVNGARRDLSIRRLFVHPIALLDPRDLPEHRGGGAVARRRKLHRPADRLRAEIAAPDHVLDDDVRKYHRVIAGPFAAHPNLVPRHVLPLLLQDA